MIRFWAFLVISEVGSDIYIANLAIFKIWVFSATFWHEITLYAIDIDKKRFRTPFFNTLEPLWKSALWYTRISPRSDIESYLPVKKGVFSHNIANWTATNCQNPLCRTYFLLKVKGTSPQIYTVLNLRMKLLNFPFLLLFHMNLTCN